MKPVYLGGQGLVCAAGHSRPDVADALRHRKTAPQRRRLSVGERPYAAIADVNGTWLERLRTTLTHGLNSALNEAGLSLEQAARLPLFVGSSSLHVGLGECQGSSGQIPRIAHLSCYIRHWFGWRAPISFYTTACTSSLVALANAANVVATGKAPAAVALGIELENRTSLNGFTAMGLLSPSAARPFCSTRDGLLLGEAVAVAVATPAPSRWRLKTIELGLDPHSPTGVDPSGRPQSDLMRRALTGAGWRASNVDLIKAHAAGSPSNDLAEARALRELFSAPPPVTSIKAAVGHTLGASGLTELSALIACLEDGFIPATDGYAVYDADIGIEPTAAALTDCSVKHALLNWIGFGGSLAALALEDASLC